MQKALTMTICSLVFLIFNGYAQEGFVGPYQGQATQELNVSRTGQITPMTVSEVSTFAHDTPVILVGNIINITRKDTFTFKDSTGEITVKIKQGDWKGLSVTPSDRVILAGHLKYNKMGVSEVDVKIIIKG